MTPTTADCRRNFRALPNNRDVGRVLMAAGDDVASLYRRAYPEHESLPEGSESRFAVWLLATYGQMPQAGEQLLVPPYEDMLAVAGLANREIHDRASEVFRSGVTCPRRAKVRIQQRRHATAGREPNRGLAMPAVEPRNAPAAASLVTTKGPSFAQTDPTLDRLLDSLAEIPEKHHGPEQLVRGLVDALATEGSDSALEALAKRLGLPGQLGRAGGKAFAVTNTLFGGHLDASQLVLASRELERVSAAQPEHFLPMSQAQFDSVERALSPRLDAFVRGGDMTPAYFRAQAASLFSKGDLKLTTLRGLRRDDLVLICRALIGQRRVGQDAPTTTHIAERMAEAIEDAAGRRFLFEAASEARSSLARVAATLSELGEPEHLLPLVKALRAGPGASRDEILCRLGLSADVVLEAPVLAGALAVVAARALRERDLLLNGSKGPALVMERYPQSVQSVASRLGLQLNEQGDIIERAGACTVLEAGISSYRDFGSMTRGVFEAVSTIATAPMGQLLVSRIGRYLLGSSLEVAPDLLEWAARLTVVDSPDLPHRGIPR